MSRSFGEERPADEQEEGGFSAFLRGTRRLLNRPFFSSEDTSSSRQSTRGGASSGPQRIASIDNEKLLSQDLCNAYKSSQALDTEVKDAETGEQLTRTHALILYRAQDLVKNIYGAEQGGEQYRLYLKSRHKEDQILETIRTLYEPQLFQTTAKTLASSAHRPSSLSKRQLVNAKPLKGEQITELSRFLHHCIEFLLKIGNWRSWLRCNATDPQDGKLHQAAKSIQEYIDSVNVPFWDVQIKIPLTVPDSPLAENKSPYVVIPAHRFILTARTDFFTKALSQELPLKEAREGVVQMDTSLATCSAILHHIYTGSTAYLLEKFDVDKTEVLLSASKYGVEDLATYIVEHMKANVAEDNATEALHTSLSLPKKFGYGLRMKAMEFLTKRNDVNSFDPEFWENLPHSIKEEIKALNKARTENPLGEATLGCMREFVGMLKEARLGQREMVESLRERVRQDERSLEEFKAKVNRQQQQVDAQIQNGSLTGSTKDRALELLNGEFHEIESRKQWLSKQQNLLQQRERYLQRLEDYTNDQIRQMEALKQLNQEHS
eukprot:gb/GECG01006730.1/.p1 GENE.gb/GECG01006730.1/~~gb/GECG01006730.1/.p1  ORF type:complete len:549 (+),score=78.51 gb/GECG01006730.1/:1-1647(+)